jgi:hypothetical protein
MVLPPCLLSKGGGPASECGETTVYGPFAAGAEEKHMHPIFKKF